MDYYSYVNCGNNICYTWRVNQLMHFVLNNYASGY